MKKKAAASRRDMRRFDRRAAELPVTVRAAGSTVKGGLRLDSGDLSEGGAFLRSDLLFEVGEALDLEIALPSGPIVKASGRVVRVAKDEQAGMGIEFVRLSVPDRRAIAASLGNLGGGARAAAPLKRPTARGA